MIRMRPVVAGLMAIALLTVSGCVGQSTAPTQLGGSTSAPASTSEPVKGGTLKVAIIGDPPALDPHYSGNFLTQSIDANFLEALFTLDEKYETQPMLAEKYVVNNDGKTYTVTLRKGVKFHNGKEMTSADVVASLNRWGKLTASGKLLYKVLVSMTAKDPYTLEIQLKEPLATVPLLLASPQQQSFILPKEVVEAAKEQQIQVKDLIGTGPYKLEEYVPNRHIRLVRFPDYAARTESASLQAGKKLAYLDAIEFIPVPEPQVRIQGVQTGLYHFAEEVPADLYSTLKDDPNVKAVMIRPWWYPIFVFNKKQGLFTNVKARQAVLAALDFEPLMAAAFGNPDFYRLDNSLHFKESRWWTDEGKELYNQKNPEKAKQLLAEAGYNGQTIRILTSKQYDWMYKLVVAMKPQLEAVGLKVQLDVVDWASLVDRRGKPDQYDIFTTAQTFFPDPSMPPNYDDTWPGWWLNSQKDQLQKQIAQEGNPDKRMELQKQFQRLFWTELPYFKTGDFFLLAVASKKLNGPVGSPFPHYFNNWLSK